MTYSNFNVAKKFTAVIAIKDEPAELIRRAILTAIDAGITRVVVADNSAKPEVPARICLEYDRICLDYHVKFVHVPWSKTKAENLNRAMTEVSTEFVVLLDVDTQLHSTGWISAVSALFARDSSIACVQLTPIVRGGWRDVGDWLTRRERDLFDQELHLCCGHAAVWRKDAMIPWEPVLCEDTAQSISAYERGYRIVRVLLTAMDDAPESWRAVKIMYSRWTVGTWQLFGRGLRAFKGRQRLAWVRHCLDFFIPYYDWKGWVMVAIAIGAIVRPPKRFHRTPKESYGICQD